MQTQKYSVNQHPIETILSWVKSGEIAIPEIQRPFVWDGAKVRDLMDSLYQGFPIGYLISWKNPNVQLKDGSLSEGKKILIDGQQRVTALRAAVLDEYVIDKNYKQIKITIAFNPEFAMAPLRNLSADEVHLHLIDEISPGVLRSGTNFLYVLMPMRVNA